MGRAPTSLVIAFAFGFLLALAVVPGCSEAANRTLAIFQLQSTETYPGAFRIDISELPPDAIESKTEAGGLGDPMTQIRLNMDYEIEVVLRPVGTNQATEAPIGNAGSRELSE